MVATPKISPLAPASFPKLLAVGGVRFATAACGVKYTDRTDVLLGARGLVPKEPSRRPGPGIVGKFWKRQRVHGREGMGRRGGDRVFCRGHADLPT